MARKQNGAGSQASQRNRRRALREGRTACLACGREMFFQKWETLEKFKARAMLLDGDAPFWPEEIKGQIATTDHLIARKFKGSGRKENLICLCATCNVEKAHHSMSEWIGFSKRIPPENAEHLIRLYEMALQSHKEEKINVRRNQARAEISAR